MARSYCLHGDLTDWVCNACLDSGGIHRNLVDLCKAFWVQLMSEKYTRGTVRHLVAGMALISFPPCNVVCCTG